MTKIVTTVNT